MMYRSSPQGLVAAVAFVVAAFAAAPALASGSDEVTTTKTSDQNTAINEHSDCTGDDITGIGHSNFVEEYSTTMHKTRLHEECSDCMGYPSGAQYQVNGQSTTETKTTARNYTDSVETRFHLFRKQATGSFMVPPAPGTITQKNDDEFYRLVMTTVIKEGHEPQTTDTGPQFECK